MNHNEIITQALNELTKSLLKLEKTTDIPQELDEIIQNGQKWSIKGVPTITIRSSRGNPILQ